MAIYVITLKEFFAGAGEEVEEGGTEFWDVFHLVHPNTPVVRLLDHIHQDVQINRLHILWQIKILLLVMSGIYCTLDSVFDSGVSRSS